MITLAIRCVLALSMSYAMTSQATLTNLSRRFVPIAQTASTIGNAALWHNPAGLAFMGGNEAMLHYLYEWSEPGNRHHGGINLAINLWHIFTFAGAVSTQAAILEKAKANLGTNLNGIFGGAFKLGEQLSFGISMLKSHNFLSRATTPALITFGLQLRPFSFLSIGSHYEETDGAYFAAPTIVAGVSVRPYKEIFTLGFDTRFVAKGKDWDHGFALHPILNLKTAFGGYSLGVGAEFPQIPDGFKRPLFSLLLDINFAHLGMSIIGAVNTVENNFALGASLRSSSEEWASVRRSSDLWVKLTIDHDGTLEKKPKSLAERLFSQRDNPLAVLALLKRIENDASIAHVELRFNGFSFGDAKTQEWRHAIESLRKAKKEVIVYLDAPSERDYYIASAANKIYMNQYASLSLSNFQATLVYFADALQKLGIKADAVVAGRYKTAPRQWINARPQKEEIEVATTILTNFYESLLRDVAQARNIDENTLKTIFDKGEITAADAKNAGLVDELISPVKDLQDQDEKSPKHRYVDGYADRTLKRDKWYPAKKIVVIPIIDTIASGRFLPGLMSWLFPITGAKDIIDEIEDAADDDNVAGIIVRIDSPGGDASAGHRISQALREAQKKKPIITSMSDVAASAGYLIAAGTEHILALPNTVTGSIGVFSLMFSGEQLAEKVGIFSKELSPIKNPGPTIFRAMTKDERTEAERITDWFYQNFIESVSLGLNLDIDVVKKIADGRVWLGKEALERKLIHELGGFSQAVTALCIRAGIPGDEELVIDVRSPGQSHEFSFTESLSAMFQNKNSDDKNAVAALAAPYLKALEAYRINAVPQARLPFDISWRK